MREARLTLLPLWEKVAAKRPDEGCSRESERLTPLEHPSTVSALSRRSTFSHKGRRKGRALHHLLPLNGEKDR
ncbi:hypothetical protein CK230_11320 [Mesorhizobium sp. WSM3859]|nr:hypothetical protein CK230_11320 [Mesorhizobium sp. WSM3859]